VAGVLVEWRLMRVLTDEFLRILKRAGDLSRDGCFLCSSVRRFSTRGYFVRLGARILGRRAVAAANLYGSMLKSVLSEPSSVIAGLGKTGIAVDGRELALIAGRFD
jgi:hypothetical protein